MFDAAGQRILPGIGWLVPLTVSLVTWPALAAATYVFLRQQEEGASQDDVAEAFS